MIGGNNLGKVLWLGAVGLVTTSTKNGRIEFLRLNVGGIICVSCLSSVAGFAGYVDVAAEFFLIDYLGVTALANFVPGVSDRTGCDFRDSIPTIVAVLSKRFGHYCGSYADKDNYGDRHDGGKSDQVSGIFEQVAHPERNGGAFLFLRNVASSIPAIEIAGHDWNHRRL